jgi:beta-glucosidase
MKKNGNTGKVVKTVLSGAVCAVSIAAIAASNILIPSNSSSVMSVLGMESAGIDNSKAKTDGLDLDYNKSDYQGTDDAQQAKEALDKKIAAEGIVLLKNNNHLMPFAKDTTFSFVGHSSVSFLGGSGSDLKTSFENEGFGVNETLWNFYSSGNGSSYGLGVGSVSYGDDEDFSVNECPLSVMESESGLLDSMKGTVPVFVLSRVAGEGRDMPRSMVNHTDVAEDKDKTYLEPNSVELAILDYLNKNFDHFVVILNSGAALDVSFADNYDHLDAMVSVPNMGTMGLTSLAQIFDGTVNPSGHTVDTYELDPLSSPAAQNFGDFQYYDESGNPTKYNYISYKEGIYVGYRYYETRYEDSVLKQGNAGDFDYDSLVAYPFGYGLSYTDFDWSDFATSWDGTTCTATVTVTNTGDAAGSDTVEIYAQSPYTDYDKENHVEKSSVELVGYARTGELQPGESKDVTVTFDQSQLKSYDYTTAKTHILDAGTYYITAGQDAHEAVNNILAAKGKTMKDGMTSDGDKDLVQTFEPYITDTDTTTYATDDRTGTAITNELDEANGDLTYLSRSDWEGTFPTIDGEPSDQVSTWGGRINGKDANGNPAAYTYKKTISADNLAKLDSFDSGNPQTTGFNEDIVYGKKNNVTLIQLRGLDYDDPLWDDLLDELTQSDYQNLITQSGYGTFSLKSVDKPAAVDRDAATGLINYSIGSDGSFTLFGYTYCGVIVLAQTWDRDLAHDFGVMVGNTSFEIGVNGWYAPAMNIHRTPFSGRNNEYYSEDGFLSGSLASAEVDGAATKGVYSFIKHFAFNDQEDHRGDREGQYSLATFLNEQAAREIYLVPFEMCIKSGNTKISYVKDNGDGTFENATAEVPSCLSMMTSFNRIGYTWAGGSYNLITGIVRGEWGFNGFIVTDNANTGVFMDAGQMIQAGADGKLTNLPASARYDFDVNNETDYHFGRIAAHHILYTIVNSNAMDGGMTGSRYVPLVEPWQKLIYAIDVIGCALIALMVILTIRRFVKKPAKKN